MADMTDERRHRRNAMVAATLLGTGGAGLLLGTRGGNKLLARAIRSGRGIARATDDVGDRVQDLSRLARQRRGVRGATYETASRKGTLEQLSQDFAENLERNEVPFLQRGLRPGTGGGAARRNVIDPDRIREKIGGGTRRNPANPDRQGARMTRKRRKPAEDDSFNLLGAIRKRAEEDTKTTGQFLTRAARAARRRAANDYARTRERLTGGRGASASTALPGNSPPGEPKAKPQGKPKAKKKKGDNPNQNSLWK